MLFVAFFKLLLSNEVQVNYYRHYRRRLVGSSVQTLKGLGIRKGEQKIVENEMGVGERQHALLLKDHVIAWLARLGSCTRTFSKSCIMQR